MAILVGSAQAKNLAQFITNINALIGPLLTNNIRAVQFYPGVTLSKLGDDLQFAITYDTTGTTITNPYLVNVFSGNTLAIATAAAQTFITANPTFFFSSIYTLVNNPGTSRVASATVCIIYNASSANGAANWQAGGTGGGGGTGTIGGSIANHQVAVGSGVNTISGTGGLTLNGNLFQNASSAGNALLGVNAVTGSSGIIDFQVNSVQQYQLLGSATAFTLTDIVNSFNPLVYTAGTTSTSLFQAASRFRFSAANTARASINLPAGTAPTSPLDGDMWTTTLGAYVQINGATVGPLGAGGGGITGTLVSGRVSFANGASSITDSAQMVFSTADGLSVNRAIAGGARNEFFGLDAGNTTATSVDNTAVGQGALVALTTGSGVNTGVGSGAGAGVTSGSSNTFVGYRAGLNVTIGASNTFLGSQAGFRMFNGGSNVAIGTASLAGSSTVASNTGTRNIVIGTSAVQQNTTAGSNVIIGTQAGSQLVSGGNNVLIGDGVASGLVAGSGNIVLGSGADAGDVSNNFVVGSGTAAISTGYFGNGPTNATPQAFALNATGGSGTNIAGASFTLAGGISTGTGAGGSILLKTSPAGGASNSTPNALVTALSIDSNGVNTLGINVGTFPGNVIYGAQSGAADVAGQVGENGVVSNTSGTNLSTGGYVAITSKTLSAGVWLIGGDATINGGATGLTLNSTLGLTVTTGGGGGNVGQTESQETVLVLKASGLFAISAPWRVVNISVATTYNLNCLCSFAAGQAVGFGNIVAVRIR